MTKSPVVKEARRLDRLFPDWHNNINVQTLNLSDAELCVLAQGAPQVPYHKAIEIVNDDREADGIDICDGVYAQNQWLPDWITEITARATP
jgi:hypothetical protein